MGVIDWILLTLIASYVVYVLFFKKQKGCCGDCSKCANCKKDHEKNPL